MLSSKGIHKLFCFRSKPPKSSNDLNPAATADGGTATNIPNAETLTNKAATVLDKASTLLNIFALTQLGCGAGRFQKNTLKKTPKGNHWGDLRAQLEIDIQEIISLVSSIPVAAHRRRLQKPDSSSDSEDAAVANVTTDDEDNDNDEDGATAQTRHKNHHTETNIFYSDETLASIQMEITTMIRKHFAVTLQRLMEHGLREDVRGSTSLVPFIGCFGRRSSSMLHGGGNTPGFSGRGGMNGGERSVSAENQDYGNDDEHRQMHVWELILEYYHIKNGDKFNETPARKLSQSFNLDISGTTATSNKQSLLSAIGSIISIHAPYKRSYNSHFKALISTGLK